MIALVLTGNYRIISYIFIIAFYGAQNIVICCGMHIFPQGNALELHDVRGIPYGSDS